MIKGVLHCFVFFCPWRFNSLLFQVFNFRPNKQSYPTQGTLIEASAHLDVDHSLLDIGYSSFAFRVTLCILLMNQACFFAPQ
jgi:hypothetical protein